MYVLYINNQNKMVFFGLQAFIKNYLFEYFYDNFFNLTKEEVLKYYTDSENDISQLDAMRWNKTDKSNYLSVLHTVLNPIFTTKSRD